MIENQRALTHSLLPLRSSRPQARTSEGTFGLVWNAAPSPSARVDAVTHTSALELLVAACALPPLPETEAHAQAAAHAQ